jgi:putative ABC transport system permease protein
MILIESLVLSVLGWMLGMGMSMLLTWILSISPANSTIILPSTVSPEIMLEALLLAIVAGFAGATYPALFAARLLPTEALRHE